jgi:hypothetical protein
MDLQMKIRVPNLIVALLIIGLSLCPLMGCKKSSQAGRNEGQAENQTKAIEKKIRQTEFAATQFQTDKPNYQPGEPIQLTIAVNFKRNSAVRFNTKDFGQLSILDAKEKSIYQNVYPGEYSSDVFHCKAELNAPATPGEYRFSLKLSDHLIDSNSTFSVR